MRATNRRSREARPVAIARLTRSNSAAMRALIGHPGNGGRREATRSAEKPAAILGRLVKLDRPLTALQAEAENRAAIGKGAAGAGAIVIPQGMAEGLSIKGSDEYRIEGASRNRRTHCQNCRPQNIGISIARPHDGMPDRKRPALMSRRGRWLYLRGKSVVIDQRNGRWQKLD